VAKRTAKKSRSRAELENNPSRRKRPDPIRPDLFTETPDPPDTLAGDHATALWTKLADHLVALNLLSPLDLEALAVLCDAWELYVSLAEYATPDQAFFVTETGYVAEHPAVRMRAKAVAQMSALWRQFGLTPLTRENLDVDLQSTGDDSITSFASKRD